MGGGGGNCIKVQHFENWKLFKIVWLIRRGNVYDFYIYYRTINQRDKHVFQVIYKNSNIKFKYNFYHIRIWIVMQRWLAHIYSFCIFRSYRNKFQWSS